MGFFYFERHGKEFKNADDYAKGAKEFLNNPPKGTLTRVRKDGDVVRYNEKSNEFGVMTKDGNIRSYFKPNPSSRANPNIKTGKEYFYAR